MRIAAAELADELVNDTSTSSGPLDEELVVLAPVSGREVTCIHGEQHEGYVHEDREDALYLVCRQERSRQFFLCTLLIRLLCDRLEKVANGSGFLLGRALSQEEKCDLSWQQAVAPVSGAVLA